MTARKGFTSIFQEYETRRAQDSLDNNDFNIEEFSDSDNNNYRLKELPATSCRLKIKQCRSAKKTPSPMVSIKRKLRQDAMPQCRRKVLGTVNTPERLNISPKSLSAKESTMLQCRRKVLGTVNTPERLNISPKSLSAQESTWSRVNNVFSPVRINDISMASTLKESNNVYPSSSNNLNEIEIEWSNDDSSLKSSPPKSQIIENISSQRSNTPTDLDMLIALIEHDNVKKVEQELKTKSKSTTKKGRKGSYESKLNRVLQTAKADRKFLKHDKRFGIKSGVKLIVLRLEESFGVHLATVQSDISAASFNVVLDASMASLVKIGSHLEAFFDITEVNGYQIEGEGNLFLRPHKIMLL